MALAGTCLTIHGRAVRCGAVVELIWNRNREVEENEEQKEKIQHGVKLNTTFKTK